MPTTLFIADLHLDKRYPQALSAFLRFLQALPKQDIDALYILGDLFEYWLGDDCADTTANQVAKGLSNYHQQTGTPLYFIHGNRDFLLGHDFATQCAMQILQEQEKINLYGKETLVMHGDTLCTDDIAYMRFRNRVRNPKWQNNIRRLPAWIRRLKAQQMRYYSKKANASKSTAIMDVVQSTVEQTMHQQGVFRLIHGHTHRPAIHHFTLDDQTATRCVVGDWYHQGSVLAVTPDETQLLTLPFSH